MSEPILTAFEIDTAFAFTDFGAHKNNTENLAMACLKCASGYYSGFTMFKIMLGLELIKGKSDKYTLTKKGKMFLHESFAIEGY